MNWLIGIAIVLMAIISFLLWNNLSKPKIVGLVHGQLQSCPKKPNCVCSCQNDPAHYIAPLPFSCEESLDQIQTFLDNHYNVQVIQRTPDYLYVVATTPGLRFKDDLEFAIDREKGIIEVRSASRVGYSDLGVNRTRIEALRAFLKNN